MRALTPCTAQCGPKVSIGTPAAEAESRHWPPCLHLVGRGNATASVELPRDRLKRREQTDLQEKMSALGEEEATSARSKGENLAGGCRHFLSVNFGGHRNCAENSNFVGHECGWNDQPARCWRLSGSVARAAPRRPQANFLMPADNQIASRQLQLGNGAATCPCLESNLRSGNGARECVRKSFVDCVETPWQLGDTENAISRTSQLQCFQCSKTTIVCQTLLHKCDKHFIDSSLSDLKRCKRIISPNLCSAALQTSPLITVASKESLEPPIFKASCGKRRKAQQEIPPKESVSWWHRNLLEYPRHIAYLAVHVLVYLVAGSSADDPTEARYTKQGCAMMHVLRRWSSSPRPPRHLHSLLLLLLLLLLSASLGASDANSFENPDLTGQGGFYGDMMYPMHEQKDINVGLILPHTVFNLRMYRKNINTAFKDFPGQFGDYSFSFSNVEQEMFQLTPSPTAILDTLCDRFLPKRISAILYVTNDETYGRNTASSQYFLQLAGYLGIPVIAWNADNSGLEQASQTGLILQLAPSIHHQAHAMLSILVQYQWHAFTIITSQIAGHTDFVETILEKVNQFSDPTDTSTANFKFTIIDTITVEHAEEDLVHVKNSEARILLLYSTKNEGEDIMRAAEALGLTGKNYVWIVTQSIIGENLEGKKTFPVGMLGVHFDTDTEALQAAIVKTIRTFAYGVQSFVSDVRNAHVSLVPDISCQGDAGAKWESGVHFYRYLNNVTIDYVNFLDDTDLKKGERPPVRFDADGNRVDVELKIMNLRDTTGAVHRAWEEIGTWRSWETDGLYVNDIVWPGYKHVPPPGVPEKFHLRISFMDEPPYISMTPPDSNTALCNANSGVKCFVSPKDPPQGAINTTTANNETAYYMCCSGFCIDLLKKFSVDLGFTYDLTQVEDKKWGTIEGTKWNGLVASLLNQKADMALSSFKINSDRESVVDFTVPFLESGISIVVAKRTGIISPTAFLEPFDMASWMLVAFVAIQVAALTIFLFEWLSPEGYNMKVAPPRDHKFSLLRTYWLVWAVLFQAAVHVDCPKGFTARFMANIWAMFAVVFLAIYTANLAAFMITREEYHDLSGVDDQRLSRPYTSKPPFKFGTVPFTNSDSVFAKHLPQMYSYMSQFNRSHPNLGILATKKGELDAFIYDATVLDYLVGQDEECRLLTVGSWYHMTGYGVAFPRGSKHTANFNKKLMEYKNNGDIERLQKFWLHGACRPKKSYKRASEPLALEQFLSAYLLLLSGVVLALLLLVLEHVYFKYLRKRLAKKDSGGCCALISLSMGKSLTFRGAVYEATDKLRRHRCRDPLCQTHIMRVKYELDRARFKIRQLEKELESHGVKPSRKFATSAGTPSASRSGGSLGYPPQQQMGGKRGGSYEVASMGGSSHPNTPSVTARELLAIRDMTRNHVTSNDPSRRSFYTQSSSSAMLSQQSSDVSRLTSLSPTGALVFEGNVVGSPGSVRGVSSASTTSLIYQDAADAAGVLRGAARVAAAAPRHRASMVDMREFKEMETVL